jgi:hypothetical protein
MFWWCGHVRPGLKPEASLRSGYRDFLRMPAEAFAPDLALIALRLVYSNRDNLTRAGVAELADARDSKSRDLHWSCGFDPHLQHQLSMNRVYPLNPFGQPAPRTP